MSDCSKYDGWTTDPEMARKYLFEYCRLEKEKLYGFYFKDGTGFFGKPEDFIPYLIRRPATPPLYPRQGHGSPGGRTRLHHCRKN